MERAWKEKEACGDFDVEFKIIDRVRAWLEGEDSDLEIVMSYGLCLAAVTYFLARLGQMLF